MDRFSEFPLLNSIQSLGQAPFGTVMIVSGGQDVTSGMSVGLSHAAAWVYEAAKKLERLGKLKPGWDSYGGSPLSDAARTLTVQVLDWLGKSDLPVPAVVLGSNGNVHLEWRKSGKELEVELGNKKSIGFVRVSPGGRITEGTHEYDQKEMLMRDAFWLAYA